MILRKTMLAAAALAVLMAGPGASFAPGPSPLKPTLSLRESLSIGGIDQDLLYQWTGLAVDRAGSIYVLDMMDDFLKKFDPRGKPAGKAGGKGQGPGEFLAPRLLDCSDRYLFATDQNVPGIMVFDHGLGYLRTIRTPFLISHLAALSDDRIAVKSVSFDSESAILILDGRGTVVGRLALSDRKPGWLQDTVSFVPDGSGGFLVAYLFQDRVERWSASSTPVWAKSLFGGRPAATEKIGGFVLPSETCFKDVATDSRGFIYVLGGNRAKHPGRDIFVLDGGGALVQVLTLAEPTHCAHIDRRNNLYVRADDGVTIRRYEIRYE